MGFTVGGLKHNCNGPPIPIPCLWREWYQTYSTIIGMQYKRPLQQFMCSLPCHVMSFIVSTSLGKLRCAISVIMLLYVKSLQNYVTWILQLLLPPKTVVRNFMQIWYKWQMKISFVKSLKYPEARLEYPFLGVSSCPFSVIRIYGKYLNPLLLIWFNFHPSMDK